MKNTSNKKTILKLEMSLEMFQASNTLTLEVSQADLELHFGTIMGLVGSCGVGLKVIIRLT